MEESGNIGLDSLGEFGLIRRLTKDIIPVNAGTLKGIGDDAAVLDHGTNCTVVTSDLLLEGIHFDLTYSPLRHLGYKAVVVNLSDVYAMNAVPQQITVNLGISSKMTIQAIDDLYEGIKLACRIYHVDIVGGDTCSSVNGLTISITAIGAAKSDELVYRHGAKKGDLICVTGDLGSAYMGLMLLQRENRLFQQDPAYHPVLSGYQYIIERQLKPEACSGLRPFITGQGIKPTAMIDLSDGLSSDLLHICESSGSGCRIFAEKIPLHEETERLSAEMYISPYIAALNGGEDYELLFTASMNELPKIQGQSGISVIGQITGTEDGCHLIMPDRSSVLLEAGGWNAFGARK